MFGLSSYLSCLLPLGNLFFILFLVMNPLFWNQQICCLVYLISVTSSSSHLSFCVQPPNPLLPPACCYLFSLASWEWYFSIFFLKRGEVGFWPDVKHLIHLFANGGPGALTWSFSSSFWGPLKDPTDSKLWIFLNKSAQCVSFCSFSISLSGSKSLESLRMNWSLNPA